MSEEPLYRGISTIRNSSDKRETFWRRGGCGFSRTCHRPFPLRFVFNTNAPLTNEKRPGAVFLSWIAHNLENVGACSPFCKLGETIADSDSGDV